MASVLLLLELGKSKSAWVCLHILQTHLWLQYRHNLCQLFRWFKRKYRIHHIPPKVCWLCGAKMSKNKKTCIFVTKVSSCDLKYAHRANLWSKRAHFYVVPFQSRHTLSSTSMGVFSNEWIWFLFHIFILTDTFFRFFNFCSHTMPY